jgi:hypothetical protein
VLRTAICSFALSLLVVMTSLPTHAGTFTAASCNQSDVNAVINGPTHTAVDGDVIQIPAGTCTWTSGITVPPNIGITIIGSGTPNSSPSSSVPGSGCTNTAIASNVSGSYVVEMFPHYGNSTARISCIDFEPGSGKKAPIAMVGTCTSSGCPNIRVDNNTFPSAWVSTGISDASVVIAVNVFGVLDHNNVGDSTLIANGVDLVNVNHSSWLGVGFYGDNSWAQPDTFGTSQALYLENNTFTNAFGTDVDGGDSDGDTGGGRFVCRFNVFNSVTQASACGDHGTESTGRPRGGRQAEFYDNTLTCTNTSTGCPSVLGLRSGVSLTFDNSLSANSGAWFNNYAFLGVFRSISMDFNPWTGQGSGPHDTNTGASATSTFALSTVSGTCTYNNCTLTASSQSWTTNQFAPGSSYYTVSDVTSGAVAGISANGTDTLTLSWCGGNGATCYANFSSGDTVLIMGRTLYAHGKYSGSSGSTSFVDSTQTWSTNQWTSGATCNTTNGTPCILVNTTQGWACEISSNTSDTIGCLNVPTPNWANQSVTAKWNSGDTYGIVQTTVYLDQESRYGGTNFSGESCGSSAGIPTCVGSVGQTLDPSYEWGDTHTGSLNQNPIGAGTAVLLKNRDYYYQNASFNGTGGTGTGTLASRPSTCMPGVAYWATDQGDWNQSGSGGQGELFVCTATNTWTLSYTPYTYPHPLIAGGTTGDPVNPPTNVKAALD